GAVGPLRLGGEHVEQPLVGRQRLRYGPPTFGLPPGPVVPEVAQQDAGLALADVEPGEGPELLGVEPTTSDRHGETEVLVVLGLQADLVDGEADLLEVA